MFTLPKLSYPYDALEPYIDAKTMEIHHTKHHQAYIDNANKALAGSGLEKMDVGEMIKNLSKVPEEKRMAVRNNAGGHANHSMFWEIMAPSAGGEPLGKVADAIAKTWGSFDKFREAFEAAGLGRFGSGWAWVVSDKGSLSIMSTPNQDNPLMEGKKPILGVDVWEHAYYLKYQNKRIEYLKNWWNVLSWKQVEKNFTHSMK